jgi:CRISPR/Cas system-associated endonuclease/helicase Cas3
VGFDCDSAYKEICGFNPREHQRTVWNKLSEDIPGFCLLSGTGSGKTEAVMIPSLVFNKRLIMVYPVRSLVDDQIERAKRYIRQLLMCRVSDKNQERKTLIIDMGGTEEANKYRLFDEKSTKVIFDQIRFWSSNKNFKGITISENHSDEPREHFGSDVDLRAISQALLWWGCDPYNS